MSEYRYYEFLAIDRPLSQSEMAELRQLTTRATITPTRLQNVYHYGDFKGDPDVLMENYFYVQCPIMWRRGVVDTSERAFRKVLGSTW